MTYYEALARIFNNDADREAEHCQSGYVKKIERTPRNEYKPLGDNRDINPACMSAAFINGDITGGEDF